MLTRIDHMMICVPKLDEAIDAYTRIGFNVYPGGAHAGRATHNAIAFLQDDYLELLSLRDTAAPVPGSSDARLAELRAGGRIRAVGGVLVKAPTPSQDRRLDLPTIGPQTIESAARARLVGVAVIAGSTIVAEAERIAALADDAKCFVLGVRHEAPGR